MDQQFYLDEKIVREGDGSFLTFGRRQLQNIETFFKKIPKEMTNQINVMKPKLKEGW